MTDRSGQRIDHYHLVRMLGTGSFGDVYLADDLHRKSRVAIKILPQLTESDMISFLNEARTIRLQHPHIVQVRDFGVDHHIPFIVMDYAPNGTLRQRHPKGTRHSLETVVSYVDQIADALQYAHDERMIHRDVKPENLLLGPNNEVLVSDFGIAMVAPTSRSQSVLEMAGTVSYMAPEQIQGRPCFASDQYALAIIVFEWLCGERPFIGAPMEIATQHMLAPLPSLCEKVQDVPTEVEGIVHMALAKNPQDRFPRIEAFARALAQVCKEQGRKRQVRSSALPPVVPFSVSLEQPSPGKEQVAPTSEPPAVSAEPSVLASVKRTDPISSSRSVSSPASSWQPVPRALPSASPVSSPPAQESARSHPNAGGRSVRPRSRLFYPTVIGFIFLLVASISGGSYFFVRSHDAVAAIDPSLQAASGSINQAKAALARTPADPVTALNRLASARSRLLTVQQQSASLNGTESSQFNILQQSFTATGKSAISQYNSQSFIAPLSCPANAQTTITGGNMTVQPRAMTMVQDSTGKNVLSYVLGDDKNLYPLTSQHSLGAKVPVGTADTLHVEAIASTGSHVLALLSFPGQSNAVNYRLSLFNPQQNGILQEASSVDVVIPAGYTPRFLTAWNTAAYLVLVQQAASSSTRIITYILTGTGTGQHFVPKPATATISISKNILSLAAMEVAQKPQLIFLFSDGSIQGLQLVNGASGSPSPVNMMTKAAIPAPLSVSATSFALNQQTPVPTPMPVVSNGGPSALLIPGASMLAVGVAGNNAGHLYVIAPAMTTIGARILDLKVAAGGGVASQNTPMIYMDVAQQYAPDNTISTVKSIVVDPQGNGFSLLTQGGQNGTLLVSQNACTP